ncbi:MAG: polysialyltransferase family glycosyltransferase [Gammaproteobacteria bacterium]
MNCSRKMTVKLFFVKTGLERVMTDIIAEPYSNDAKSFLFAYKQDLLRPFLWDGWSGSIFLNPKKKKGLLATRRTVLSHFKEIVDLVYPVCIHADVIEIHLSILKSSKNNYVINYIKDLFPSSKIVVNIIPHGTSNFHRPDISPDEITKMRRKNSWFLRCLFPKLRYYEYQGERYGADDPIVNTIYTFPGHSINSPKAKEVELRHFREQNKTGTIENNALILGQPVYKKDRLTPEKVQKINDRILQILSEQNCDKVFFLPHPGEDGSKCFYQEKFEWLEPEGPMELLLFKRNFRVIISSFSTGLFTSKLICSDSCEVYAVGTNLVSGQEGEIDQLNNEFKSVNINVVDV